MNLQIQCPSCTKRFTVHEDLTGKTVECGACDHRFPVKSESIIVERAKFYPGEHKDDFLDRLGKKSPLEKRGDKPAKAPLTQAQMPQVDAIMPPSSGQAIAAGGGVCMLGLYGLVFFFGSIQGQIFQDVDLAKRFLLGGFVSFLGGGLIIYGAKNWRAKGIMTAVILVLALLAMIAIRPVHMTPSGVVDRVDDPVERPDEEVEEGPRELDEVLGRTDQKAMEREIARQSGNLNGKAVEKYVTGIYIADLHETQYQAIERYFRKKLAIPKSEALLVYKRNNDKDRFIIISGVPMDFDTMVRYCEFLGRATSYPKARIIDVQISATIFQEPGKDLLEKLNKVEHPAFFAQNLNELRDIDFERVSQAVRRLSRVPAEMKLNLEEQIIAELLRLSSEESDQTFLSDAGKALGIFARGSKAAVYKINSLVPFWIEDGVSVPKSMVDFLVENDPEAIGLIDRLWSASPDDWDEHYAALGSKIEDRLIFHLQESPLELQRAATKLIDEVGTKKSVPALTALASSDDTDLRILVARALNTVKNR
ncbi:MAG: hypothetical protein QNL33_11120 [Akkermansiaceae bacterium]|jgi:predicted Zn finger-like uncharacterized protein